MTPSEKALAAYQASPKRCINPKCRSKGKRRQAYTRGLCQACDQALRRLIRRGEVTREEAERRGYCLPQGKQRPERF